MKSKDPSWAYFVTSSLPLRASASVFASSNLIRPNWVISVRKFEILFAVFYDDLPVAEYDGHCDLITNNELRAL